MRKLNRGMCSYITQWTTTEEQQQELGLLCIGIWLINFTNGKFDRRNINIRDERVIRGNMGNDSSK